MRGIGIRSSVPTTLLREKRVSYTEIHDTVQENKVRKEKQHEILGPFLKTYSL